MLMLCPPLFILIHKSHISEWLLNMTVNKLVVVIKSLNSNEVMERWQFDVECDKTVLTDR